MPKKAKELSAIAVANLKDNGRYMIGGADGLHLRIAGASRSWILRAVVNGKRSDIGIGSYPGVTLATARKLANSHRDAIATGVDPLAVKREKREAARVERSKAKTFEECAIAYIEAHKGEWKNDKHAKQWGATLETYAYPKFGKRPVSAIDTGLVLEVIEDRGKVVDVDLIGGRIARFDIGTLEELEAAPVEPLIAGPRGDQPRFAVLGERAEKLDVVRLGKVEFADKQEANVRALGGLV